MVQMSHPADLCLHNQITQVVLHKRWTTQTQQQCTMRSQMGNVKTSLPVYKHHPGTLYLQELPLLPKQQTKRLYRLVEPKPHHHHPPGSLHQQERHKHLPQKINHTRQVGQGQLDCNQEGQPASATSSQGKKTKKLTAKAPPHPGPSTGPSAGPRNDFTLRNLGTGRPTIQCTACSEYSHWRRECPYDNYCTTCNNHDHATHMCRAHRQATNNQGQQGQQSPQICVYCGSIEHSSSNCHRRPWDNREQPCGTPKSLRKDQQANSEILGNAMGRTAPTGANTQGHPPQPQSQRSNTGHDNKSSQYYRNYNYDYRESQRQPHTRFDERYNQRYSPPVFPPTPSLNSSFPEVHSVNLYCRLLRTNQEQ